MGNVFQSSLASLIRPGKIKSLDGLRAIAILLVLITHISQCIPNLSFVYWHTEWTTPLFNGWLGVDLFFVLSGFLIGSIIINDLNTHSFSLFSFYRHRFFRILPAYFFVVFLIVTIKQIFPQTSFLTTYHWKDILFSIGLLTDYFPTNIPIGSWSLSIEEHFYLLLPVFFILFRKTDSRVKACLLLITLALLFRMLTYRAFSISDTFPIIPLKALIYYPFHNRMDALSIGILIALLHQHATSDSKDNKIIRLVSAWIGLLLVGFVYLSGSLQGGFFNTTIQYTLISLGFGGLLWGVLGKQELKNKLQTFLSKPAWIPIARISYSTYLTNTLILKCLAAFIVIKWWMFFFILTICLLGALPLYLFIEYPCHQLGKKRHDEPSPETTLTPELQEKYI